MRKFLAAIATAAAALVALAGCGDGQNNTSPASQQSAPSQTPAGQTSGAVPAEGTTPAAQQTKVLTVNTVAGLSPIVTSASGRTVYRFDKDSANPPKSNCLDECTKTWEPVLAGPAGVEVQGGIDQGDVGAVLRPEGGLQVTLKGWPLYYYVDDLQLGQLAGQGKNGLWFAINPQGGKAQPTGGQPESSTPNKDVKVLTVNKIPGLAPIVTSASGRTVYRFDKDSTNPPTTTCLGACLEKWEPVLVAKNGAAIQGGDLKAEDFGTIPRAEGLQLTLKGHPLYYFRADKTLGEISGQGTGGIWWAIAPDGSRARPDS